MSDPRETYEVVIGLEVHVHLKTTSKLFSPAPVLYGEDPNHSVHPIDLGLPGVLPVLNEGVIDLAIRLGHALHATVHERSVFSRKNYFYPDLPKGYQISQYHEPIVEGGWIDIELPQGDAQGEATTRRIHVTRAHLEEDAGKSVHDAALAGRDDSLIDLNRSGVPLLEIVSEPELRSADEAVAYLRALREILRYVEVSDADMEKGQMRCDVNLSLRRHGDTAFGTRTEAKNINSFRTVEDAIAAETLRQAEILDEGGKVVQATMAFDAATGGMQMLRTKEDAQDYRYFDDPDLIPLVVSAERIERVRGDLPELPDRRRARIITDYELPPADARILTASRRLADFFEEATSELASGSARPEAARSEAANRVANWIVRDLLRVLNEREVEIKDAAIAPEALAGLVRLVDGGRLTPASARELLAELVLRGGEPEALMRERGLEAVSDTGLLESAVEEVIAANADVAEKVRGGDAKPLNFLMGQVMKKTKGKADAGQVRKLLAERLSSD